MKRRSHRAMIPILSLCGLPWSAGCGTLGPLGDALNGDTTAETACLDPWSLMHVLSGYYLSDRLGEDSIAPTMALLVGYEIAEPHFWPGFNESNLNQQCDIAVGTFGALAESIEDN